VEDIAVHFRIKYEYIFTHCDCANGR